MNTYHAAFWSSDPSRLSSSDEEEDARDTLITQENKKQKKLIKWRVHPLNTTRGEYGEYTSLVQPMRSIDKETHFQYFRMSVSRFDNLLQQLAPHISHERTHSFTVIAAGRLSVTIWFLASGSTQQSIAASYK